MQFNDVLTIKNGRNQRAVENPNGKYPIYGSGGVMGYADDYICKANTVVIGRKGSINNPIFVDCPFWNVDTAFGLEANTDMLLPRYLYYFCKHFNFEKLNKTVTIPSLTKADLLRIEIDLPDLSVQQLIVSEIAKVESIILLLQQEIQKLDELIKARFVEMFDDGESPMKTVEELCSEIVDCPHTTPRYEGELKHPAIRTSEIKKGYIAWDTMRYVSDEEYEERVARLRPEKGDIVYGREGTFGNAAVLPGGYSFCLGQRVMLLRPDYSKCTSEYLLHAVISDDVYRQAVEKNNASTVAHVNVKDVKQFKVPLPSFEKQRSFAYYVSQVEKSKAAVQQALDKAKLLFDSLIQKYFARGEMV